MSKYFLTEKSTNDLTDIWNYTYDEWSEHQADIYYQMLIDTFEEIARNPKIGKNYEGITKNLLGLKANRQIIFYRILEDMIEITRILHERMDLKRRLGEF